MDLKTAHQFFGKLDDQIQEIGIETTFVEGIRDPQIGDTLRILLPVTEEEYPVLTEVMVCSFSEDLDLLIIYTTLLTEMNEKAVDLPAKLSEWNIVCPLGAYGIFEEEEQLFHKYTFPFPREMSADALGEDAMMLIGLIWDVLSQQYPEVMVYAQQ